MKKIESRKMKAVAAIVVGLMMSMFSVPAIVADSNDSVGGLQVPVEDPFIDSVNITLTAVDNQSGVDYTMYKLEGVVQPSDWMLYNGTFTFLKVEGMENYTIYYYSVDKAGNIEDVRTTLFNMTTDNIAPVTTCKIEGETSYPQN